MPSRSSQYYNDRIAVNASDGLAVSWNPARVLEAAGVQAMPQTIEFTILTLEAGVVAAACRVCMGASTITTAKTQMADGGRYWPLLVGDTQAKEFLGAAQGNTYFISNTTDATVVMAKIWY